MHFKLFGSIDEEGEYYKTVKSGDDLQLLASGTVNGVSYSCNHGGRHFKDVMQVRVVLDRDTLK